MWINLGILRGVYKKRAQSGVVISNWERQTGIFQCTFELHTVIYLSIYTQFLSDSILTDFNDSSYKSNWSDQMYYLIQRCFFNYFRNYKVVFNDLLMVFVSVCYYIKVFLRSFNWKSWIFQLTALLGGLIYYKSGSIENNQCTFDQRSAEMVSFAIFYSITVSVIFSMLNAVMVRVEIFKRFLILAIL